MKRHRPLRRTRPKRGRGTRFRGYVRNEPYRRWVRQQGCLLAGRHECWGLIEFCHVTSRGAGGADEANGWPGCHRAHMEQHAIGIRSFEAKHAVSLRATAERLWRDYQGEGA